MSSLQFILDTDILSLLMRRNAAVLAKASEYLSEHRQFIISIITRYEILRGLKAKVALKQAERFETFCARNRILQIDDRVIIQVADIYADLYQRGELIADADILIAASALANGCGIVTNNEAHFRSNCLIESELLNRIQPHAREWGVVVEDAFETHSSVIAFGARDNQPVVLKVIKQTGDEWCSGEILEAFDGHGVVRVYEQTPGAVLIERLRPGHSLVEMSISGKDEEATDILADVIQQMSSVESSTSGSESLKAFKTAQDWAKGFDRYVATGDDRIPLELVEAGHDLFSQLCASQRSPRLLHGELQHYNVLFDSNRGWVAIDPKGVVGELEYEIGAGLRNPVERPELFLSRAAIERRLRQFTNKLNLDFERMLGWSFAQAVLSAIWEIEDGFAVDETNPSLRLAKAIRPMLGRDIT